MSSAMTSLAAAEAAETLAVDLPKLRGTDPVASLDLS